jgi:predicted outer membrane repeat protein
MTHSYGLNRFVAFGLVLMMGIGIALLLPWMARTQSQAAQGETATHENAPEVSVYYVAKTGDGSLGISWSTAYTNVQDAIIAAYSTKGEIWVAEGVYYPDEGKSQVDGNQLSTFVLTDGVALYGGFTPGDDELSDRDWENNLTVLSGDIDQDDTHTNGVVLTTTDIVCCNAYHVVSAKGVTGTAVLDGFTITAGDARFGSYKLGGGFFCDGSKSGNMCNPKLANLFFSGNIAGNGGGGMYNAGISGGSSNPSLINVTFSGNRSNSIGGAMYNRGVVGGESSPKLINVSFNDNSANSNGGAIYNDGHTGGDSSPSMTNVVFSGNSTKAQGGAIFNHALRGTSSPTLNNVTFSGNSAVTNGGAMYNYGCVGESSPILISVTFTNNWAIERGGAIYNYGKKGASNPEFTDVNFSENSTDGKGGAMYNDGEEGNSNPSLTNVTFSGNYAKEGGGAIFNYGGMGNSSPTLLNVKFPGNSTSSSGGAMFNFGPSDGNSSPILTNVSFSGNSAELEGGAIYNNGLSGTSNPILTNVTFSGNYAGKKGGAVYLMSNSASTGTMELRNSVLWNNQDETGPGTISATITNKSATISITHSLVQGSGGSDSWVGGSYQDGGGNIDSDPMFVTPIDPATAPTIAGDIHLKYGSPAINAGKNEFVFITTDLDANPRIVAGTVDMGAYENQDEFPFDRFLPVIVR